MGKTVVVGASAVSLAVGSILGYFYAKHQLEQLYRDEAEREIAEARKYYQIHYKRDEYATPMDAVEQLMNGEDDSDLRVFKEATSAWRTYSGHQQQPLAEETQVIDIPPQIQRNIFEGDAEMKQLNYEEEVANRDTDYPYVITKDEFLDSESNYEQACLTYYKRDGILADERDEIVEMVDRTVGLENLKRFGEFSGDPRIVYIRNDGLGYECEIALHDDSYAKIVHDIDASENDAAYLAHSDTPWYRDGNTPTRSRFNGRRVGGLIQAGDNG